MAYSLAQCALGVVNKFGNRQNLGAYLPGTMTATNRILEDNSLALQALIQAVQNLTESFEFEELKYQTPVPPASPLSLTMGQPVVLISDLLATIQGNAGYPQLQNQNINDITDIYTFWVWFANSPSVSGRTLKYRRITTIDTYSYGITSNTQGNIGVAPPVYYSRFGNMLEVGPAPNQNFEYFVRVKLRHPFPTGISQQYTADQVTGQSGANFYPCTLQAVLSGGVVISITIVDDGQGYQPNTRFPIYFDPPLGPLNIPTAYGWYANTGAQGTVTSITTGSYGGTSLGFPPYCYAASQSTQQVFMPDSWKQAAEYLACYHLATWEGAEDYVKSFAEKLSGLGIDVAKVLRLKPQMERDEMHNERQFSFRGSKYSFS